MGRVLAYVVAVIFAFPVCALFMLFVAADFVRTKEYNHAKKIMAVITSYNGIQDTSNYGRYARQTTYHIYAVTFFVDGITYYGDYLCKDGSLKQGQNVEVRYVTDKDGTVRLVNSNIRDRFYRFLLCILIAVPLSIFCIMVK